MTPCWLKSTWVDLSSTNLSLEGPITKLELLRDGDSFLTDRFIQAGYRGGDLQLLNFIQMHLQVTRFSDIATADG